MYKTILLLSCGLFIALAPARVDAQNFDTSGTANLTGNYLFRYVNFFNDQNGNLTESCSLSGTITFDGAGKYTLSGTHLADSAGTNRNSLARPMCISLKSVLVSILEVPGEKMRIWWPRTGRCAWRQSPGFH